MYPLEITNRCNCNETPTNPGVVCDKCMKSTKDFCIFDVQANCVDIKEGDNLSLVLQKWEQFLCGTGFAQYFITIVQDNELLAEEFYTLVNNAVTCEDIWKCNTTTTSTTRPVSTSTTTSTTTASPTTTTTTTI